MKTDTLPDRRLVTGKGVALRVDLGDLSKAGWRKPKCPSEKTAIKKSAAWSRSSRDHAKTVKSAFNLRKLGEVLSDQPKKIRFFAYAGL